MNFRSKRGIGILSVAALVLGSAVASNAAVVVATSNQVGDGVNPFTSTYAPLTTDLINGLSPTSNSSADLYQREGSPGITALTEGVFPVLDAGTRESLHRGLATTGNSGGTFVTYTFPTSDVARVDVYGGWNDKGRDEQNFGIKFSTDGGANWGPEILSESFNPSVGAGLQSATRVSISDNAGPLATGVNAIYINWEIGVENGYTGTAEIDVVAVPEPIGLATTGLLSLGLLVRRRK